MIVDTIVTSLLEEKASLVGPRGGVRVDRGMESRAIAPANPEKREYPNPTNQPTQSDVPFWA
eukprot:946615-Prymnesium_polylepis.1